MFSTLPDTNFDFSVTFTFSSANAFSLDQSIILTFGKELMHFLVTKKLCKALRDSKNCLFPKCFPLHNKDFSPL